MQFLNQINHTVGFDAGQDSHHNVKFCISPLPVPFPTSLPYLLFFVYAFLRLVCKKLFSLF